MLDCAADATDRNALSKCQERCDRKACKEVQDATIAQLGDNVDQATRDSMRKAFEADPGCKTSGQFAFPLNF